MNLVNSSNSDGLTRRSFKYSLSSPREERKTCNHDRSSTNAIQEITSAAQTQSMLSIYPHIQGKKGGNETTPRGGKEWGNETTAKVVVVVEGDAVEEGTSLMMRPPSGGRQDHRRVSFLSQ